jgi:predicted DNA-binding protein
MSKQISLTLPDELMRRAEVLAGRSGRQVGDILADAVRASLDPLGLDDVEADARPVSEWSDEQVIAAADLQMPDAPDRRLSELLAKQGADTLTPGERAELSGLMQAYQQGLLQKAQALNEAVRRGLRHALTP